MIQCQACGATTQPTSSYFLPTGKRVCEDCHARSALERAERRAAASLAGNDFVEELRCKACASDRCDVLWVIRGNRRIPGHPRPRSYARYVCADCGVRGWWVAPLAYVELAVLVVMAVFFALLGLAFVVLSVLAWTSPDW